MTGLLGRSVSPLPELDCDLPDTSVAPPWDCRMVSAVLGAFRRDLVFALRTMGSSVMMRGFGCSKEAMSMSSANVIRLSQESVGFIVVGRNGRVRVDEIMCVTVPLSNCVDISYRLRVQHLDNVPLCWSAHDLEEIVTQN
jgi:hypothetical protein